jgi:hypothetical protein
LIDYRGFEFHKRRQFLISTRNETLSIAAMCVSNLDRLPIAIHRCNTAPTPSGFAEIVSDDFQYFTGPVKISEGFRSRKRKTQAHGHVFRFEIDPSRYCTSLESAVASLVYFFLLLFFLLFFRQWRITRREDRHRDLRDFALRL